MKHCKKLLAWAGLLAIMFALAFSLSPMTPAHAAARQRSATGDTLTLSLTNGPTFTYDGGLANKVYPDFQVNLVLAAPSSSPLSTVTIQLDNGQYFTGDLSVPAADRVTYTASVYAVTANNGATAVGNRTATAIFKNPSTGVTDQSAPVTFTVVKLPFALSCELVGASTAMMKPGQTVQVAFMANDLDTQVPLDWTQGTATITFEGPTTVTFPNLQPDSTGRVTVTTPTQLGRYTPSCSFSGSDYYSSGQITLVNSPLVISEMLQLGGTQIYTNPTTFVANHSTQMYVVFHAAPGEPVPTGQFDITIGGNAYYTKPINVGPNGDTLITLSAISNLKGANTITVNYFGDSYYNYQPVSFPLTNPPIPNGIVGSVSGTVGSSGSSASGKPGSTATTHTRATTSVKDHASSSTTPVGTPTPGGRLVLGAANPLESSASIAGLIALVALLVVGSGVGTFLYLSRGAHTAPTLSEHSPLPTLPSEPLTEASAEYGSDDDTLPQRRIER